MRAVIYARYSTDRQSESSIADQVRVCREHADRQGWQVTGEHEDAGISGGALGNRPGAQAAIAAVGPGDVLVVCDLSRLSRSQDLPMLIARLRHRGARVVGVQDAFDSDSRTARLQAGMSGIMSEEFRAMIGDRTHSALESRARDGRPAGGKAYDNRPVIRFIFERAAEGASDRTIAEELNRRGVPSPGSEWQRRLRRSQGWMDSAVRSVRMNERYAGRLVWNRRKFTKDPVTGLRTCRERPRSQWIVTQDESLRVVSDELFERAQQRRTRTVPGRAGTGGKPKFLLSGLLRCDSCGASYIMGDRTYYVCSSFHSGRACTNNVRISRKVAEAKLLADEFEDLLAPARVERMAKAMRTEFSRRQREATGRAAAAPAEVQAIDERIERLRANRDLEPDELAAAVDAALRKRQALVDAAAPARPRGDLELHLAAAAQLYRRQVAQGLEGHADATTKARGVLRELFGGAIRLRPKGAELWADFEMHPGALLLRDTGTIGSGGRI